MSYEELVDIILLCERDMNASVQQISAKYPCLPEAYLVKIKKYLTESAPPKFSQEVEENMSASNTAEARPKRVIEAQ